MLDDNQTVSGLGTFATRGIEAAFHCFGTVEEDSNKLNMSAIGVPTFKNQAGRPSRPVAI